ncbi:hypothetical protein M2263_001263 [Providencia alcalifaciens]|nr:hypothetical protein [Providencia alcalifaciens]
MTNIQLLLLAINNINESVPITHAQTSYVYQFYHLHIANRHLRASDFLNEFIEQVDPILKHNIDLCIKRDEIYNLIDSYLQQAEERFINREIMLNKN